MQTWIKFYEAITKPLPVASSLFLIISTSFLLTASDSTLAKLGMSHVVTDHRWIVGLLFVIALTWLAVTALIWLGKWCHQVWSARRLAKKQRQRLHTLTADERRMLAIYVNTETRTANFVRPADLGVAQGLADDGILYRPEIPLQVNAPPYNIQEWALAYLSKDKELVADVVPAENRWNQK